MSLDDINWFISPNKLDEDVRKHVNDIQVVFKEYNEIYDVLRSIKNKKVWIDPTSCNFAIYESIENDYRYCDHSPISIPKAIKNETEKTGLRDSCLRDSAAIIEYLAWLENELIQNNAKINEFEATEKLAEFRRRMDKIVGESFPTISGSGSNGAIIHYHCTEEHNSIIDPTKLYLCDSGAQY